MGLYAATIFLSAFLLFQVQPIIARSILPWFGGSSAVWSTCMLFFQVALLLGYAYAHWLQGRFRARQQALGHTAALAASLAALPILPSPAWKPTGPGNPSLAILGLLAVTVGLPYLLLSTTTPLLQAWYARAHRGGLPYRLYALSNLASMLALLTYPVLVEPYLTTRMQAQTWSASYAVFVLLCAATAWSALRGRAEECAAADPRPGNDGTEPAAGLRFLWMALAACASVLLLAVTTFLTQDVAAVPFLWILPLSVYLLSFILCFDSPRFYQRAIFVPLAAGALVFMAWRLWPDRPKMLVLPQTLALAASLFVCCMICHGELVRIRPHKRYLTSFYVSVSLGGALGGVFVGLLAPNVFNAYYEFPIGLALFAILAAGALWLAASRLPRRWIWVGRGALALAAGAYLILLGVIVRDMVNPYRVVARNFYGQLRVRDVAENQSDPWASRNLIHGVINHGVQMLRAEYRRQPVSYFCPQSGIGRAMAALAGKPRRIGILGLGCGTLAAYGRAGDVIRIYEINPLVLRIANSQFTYLRDTAAAVEVALGDGRLVLESEPSQHFDLLVMDAFSGDSVPVHLITREAFQSYFRHLNPSGMVAVNISNSYLDLEPVVAQAAAAFGKIALSYDFDPDPEDNLCYACTWALIMDPATLEAHPALRDEAKILKPNPKFRIWTDDYSNMFGILR